ncbi:unnamed protein product, partial [Caretta caretta]
MLPLTDWVLELLSMERTPFRAYTVSALLLALLALLFRTLLQLGRSWHRYYVTCQRLRCFPEPPRRKWLLGHLGMFIPGEEGLSLVSQTVATFSQVFVTWMGPFLPVLGLVHPDFLKPITTASVGQSAEEGMQCVDELVGGYCHSCLWWFGPWFPILRLFHPEAVKPVLLESV